MDPRLRALYNEWRIYQPDSRYGRDATCCHRDHWVKKSFSSKTVPLDDDLVCDRELAWRKYVRYRDRNPSFGTALCVVKHA